MESNIKTLKSLLEPPLSANGNDGDWERFSEKIGPFPRGFKDFIGIYGCGCVDEFLWLFSPFAENKNINLLCQSNLFRESFRALANSYKEYNPPGFIDFEGLVCCGVTDNGDFLCWNSMGGDDFAYIFIDNRSPDFSVWEGIPTFIEFIIKLLSGELKCPFLPSSFPKKEHNYKK